MHNREKKGKTLEEIYGVEKAICIKKQISKKNKGKNKGKTYEEMYGKEKSNIIKKQNSKRRKGISYEEMYGKEEADRLKKIQSDKKLGKNKGKIYEEIYGKKKAEKMKKMHSDSMKGKNIGTKNNGNKHYKWKLLNKDKLIIVMNNFFKYEKIPLKGNFFKNKFIKKEIGSEKYIKRKLKNQEGLTLDDIAKECDSKFKRIGGRLGANERFILDEIEKEEGVKMERQFTIKVDDGTIYYGDGYDKENNVLREVYERFHYFGRQILKDQIRSQKIKDMLGCKIIIYNEQEELNKMTHKPLAEFS